MFKIDLNCDMGEAFGIYKLGLDEEILKYVTSVNIACGFHAGDPSVMNRTVKNALENNVAIGAHPGLPDLVGFGRRNMSVTPEEAYDMVVYQIGALEAFVKAQGGKMQHVKPHGALYNMAAKYEKLAFAICSAVYDVNPELIIYGLANSELIFQGKKLGLRVSNEVFADRTYQNDGSLTPRSKDNAIISDENLAIKSVINMIQNGNVMSEQGNIIKIKADTICVHGDGEKALEFVSNIRRELKINGIECRNYFS